MALKFTWRIWLLIAFVAFSLVSVLGLPPVAFEKGVLVTSVDSNSTAFNQGFREGQIITAIDGNSVGSLEDYSNALQGKFLTNQSKSAIFTLKSGEVVYFSDKVPQITVSELSKTSVRLGLDLIGGSRALVQAEERQLSVSEVRDLVDITENRLNAFGLTDLKVRQVSDLEGNNFMLIEIAGATPENLRELIAQQGKFEAKIGNQTVFVGGERDVASVCRGDPSCAFVEQCSQAADGNYFCNFRFEIFLSADAAQRHADITQNLGTNSTAQGRYLNETLDLYLDDSLVDSLLISESLRGQVATQIVISGSGAGTTQQLAFDAAEAEMHKLQTILITGSLPFKLEIVKLDTVSPLLGQNFIRVIMLAGLVALLGASAIVFARYRRLKSSLALIAISFSEIIIILGIAALIQWNLDLPSIAGILATIGTGFDDQIVILDGAKGERFLSIKQRLKRAFAIILGAYFTALVAMFPLLWAGAGLLKGFAFTTIIGITAGVFITRPAFSDIIRRMEDDE